MTTDDRSLKPGWTRVAFGDVVRQVKDRVDPSQAGLERYVAGDHMDTDDLCIRRWGKIGDGYLGPAFHMRFRPGQVLYGSRRTYLRKVAVADFEGITANTTFVLESKAPDILLPELLPFIMQADSFHKHSIEQSKGSVNPYVIFSDLTAYEFNLPPLAEQRRQVDVLLAVDRNADALRGVVEVLRALETSILHRFISEIDLTSHCHLGDLALKVEYGSSAKPTPTGVPILRIPNILQNNLNLAILKRVSLSPEETKRFRLSTGDILMVRTNGNPSYVGRCISIPALPEHMVFASYLLRIVVDATRIRPEFAARALNMPLTRKQISQHIRSSAGNYNINAPSVRNIKVPCPPLIFQEAILSKIKTLTSRSTSVTSRLITLEAIRKSFIF